MAGFDELEGYIWMDGEFVEWSDARVHFLSHGLHYGSGVFEGIRAYNGSAFKLTQHNQRLIDSSKIMDMDLKYSVEELNGFVYDVLEKNNLTNAYIRPMAWRGSEMMAIGARETTTHLGIAAWEGIRYSSKKGVGLRIKTANYRRPPADCAPVHAKANGLYMICTISKHEAERAGYDDALMIDYRGHVAEATGANIFFIKDGELHTPTPDVFLNGITRQTAIELANELGLKVTERTIMPNEVAIMDECFITGTAAEIQPVESIDDTVYGVGPITEKIITAYKDLVMRPGPEKLAREAG